MQHSSQLQQGKLIKRYKRFLADVLLDNGEQITIHCPNTGAMTGCAEPDFDVFFSTSDNQKRKYSHTFELAKNNYGHFIGINTGKANHIVKEAIEQNLITELTGYDVLKTEVKYGEENSRIDILLADSTQAKTDVYIEVKSTTLLIDADSGLGAFPDAVTERGLKHLRELMTMKQQGYRAVLVFLVQHTGIKHVTVAKHIDPKYAEQLKLAVEASVEVLVVHTDINEQEILFSHTSEFNLP